MNLNLSSAVRSVRTLVTANSPVLLVGTAVVGVITTGVLAARAGQKANEILEAYREEVQEEPDLVQKVKLTWLCYAVPAVTGASTIAAVVGAHAIHTKRHAALAGLYAVTTSKLDSFQKDLEEQIGVKKVQTINDARAQASVDRNPAPGDHEIVALGEGDELCQDEWSGRYFRGSMLTIERAFAEINIQLAEGTDVTLSEFYNHLGLKKNGMSDEFGWQPSQSRAGRLNIAPRYGNAVTADGRPAISFSFRTEPAPLRNKAERAGLLDSDQ